MDQTISSFMEYIYRRGGASMTAVMEYMDVCERTVRTYVKAANAEFAGIAKVSKRRGGDYQVSCSNPAAFERRLEQAKRGERGVYQDSESRLLYALAKLMGDGRWVKSKDIRSELFISSSTITALLKDVAAVCSEFGLRLSRNSAKGSRIEGPEFSKRLCLESAAVASRCGLERYLNIVGLDSRPLNACADAFFREVGIAASEVARRDFILSLSLVILRSGLEPSLELPKELGRFLTLPRFTTMSSTLRSTIRSVLSHTVDLNECAFVVMHLAFWCDLDEPMGGTTDVLATQLIESLDRTFRCDLSSDEGLHEVAANHLRLLFLRMLYKTPARLEPIRGVREFLPFSYVLANETCRLIESRSGREIPDGECGSIAFIFARALARRFHSAGSAPVGLVSSLGEASRDFLADRIASELGSEVTCFSGWADGRLKNCDLSRLSYILSTEERNPSMPVPVIRVGHYMSDDDLLCVRRAKRSIASYGMLAKVFPKQRFDGACKATNAHGALCDLLALLDLVDRDPALCMSLLDTQGEERMYYGNGVACVYAPRATVHQTSLACVLLPEPVSWGSHPVSAVFALVLSRNASAREAAMLLGSVCRLADRRDAVSVLKEARDHDARLQALSGLDGTRLVVGADSSHGNRGQERRFGSPRISARVVR